MKIKQKAYFQAPKGIATFEVLISVGLEL